MIDIDLIIWFGDSYFRMPKLNVFFTQLGCWAYVRNKFDQALKALKQHKLKKTTLTAQALNRIRLLYKIEKQAKKFSPEQRLALRRQYAISHSQGFTHMAGQTLAGGG